MSSQNISESADKTTTTIPWWQIQMWAYTESYNHFYFLFFHSMNTNVEKFLKKCFSESGSNGNTPISTVLELFDPFRVITQKISARVCWKLHCSTCFFYATHQRVDHAVLWVDMFLGLWLWQKQTIPSLLHTNPNLAWKNFAANCANSLKCCKNNGVYL